MTSIADLSARYGFGGPYQSSVWEVLDLEPEAAAYNRPLTSRLAGEYERRLSAYRRDHSAAGVWEPLGLEPVEWPDPDDTVAGGFTKTTWAAWRREHPDRCRDCGTTAKVDQGGSDGPNGPGTGYMLCDGCAAIDECRDEDGWHISHWGHRHRPEEHDDLAASREKRRHRYLKTRQPEQPALFEVA